MKTYKALVTDKQSCRVTVITVSAENKADAKEELRLNGYTIKSNRCLESKYYDYVIENTNCEPWDWKMAQYRETKQLAEDAFVDYNEIA